jgi:hypothetical protein
VTLELDDTFDAATRELCPDGSCTGVLDDDGVCKVCGLRGTPAAARSVAGATGDPAATRGDDAVSAGDSARGDGDGAAPDFLATRGSDETFDADRQLCPDGNCIGVLDADGRCKVCGRSIS